MDRNWIEDFYEWGLTKDDPLAPATARAYKRELLRLESKTSKHIEELRHDDLRSYYAQHRAESAQTWNNRYYAIRGFYKFLEERGFYKELNAQGEHRTNPARAISKRPLEKRTRPQTDVMATIAQMEGGVYKTIAQFLYLSGLKIGEAVSIKDPPMNGRLYVCGRRGEWEWVEPHHSRALDLLAELGGRLPLKARSIQRNTPRGAKPEDIAQASKRDFELRGAHEDAPLRALLVGRPELVDVSRAHRDAVEAMEGPNPNPKTAIVAAARALQEMMTAMGARGNDLDALFQSARNMRLFGPYDSKLAVALNALVDWVSADRSQRGDAHKNTEAGPDDAALARRIVGALILRLEAQRPH